MCYTERLVYVSLCFLIAAIFYIILVQGARASSGILERARADSSLLERTWSAVAHRGCNANVLYLSSCCKDKEAKG